MATINIKVEGIEKLISKLQKLGNRAKPAIAAALYIEGEGIMSKSKPLVPVDTDTLRTSGHVQLPEITGESITVMLGYGGPAAPYALAVHEHPSKHSPPSWAGGVHFKVGGPKYLEKPALEAASGMGERIGNRLQKEIEGAVK